MRSPGAGTGPKMCPRGPAFERRSIVQIRPMAARLVANICFEKITRASYRWSQLLKPEGRLHEAFAGEARAGRPGMNALCIDRGKLRGCQESCPSIHQNCCPNFRGLCIGPAKESVKPVERWPICPERALWLSPTILLRTCSSLHKNASMF